MKIFILVHAVILSEIAVNDRSEGRVRSPSMTSNAWTAPDDPSLAGEFVVSKDLLLVVNIGGNIPF